MTTMVSSPSGKLSHEMRLERERHAELGDADAERIQFFAADPQVTQALHQVVIGLPRGGDAQARAFAALRTSGSPD